MELVVLAPLLISARAMVTVPPAESVRVRVSSSPSASVSDTVRLALVVSLPLLIDESATDSDVPSESVSVKESSVPSESVSVTAKVELVTPPAPQTVSPAALVVKTCPSLPARARHVNLKGTLYLPLEDFVPPPNWNARFGAD